MHPQNLLLKAQTNWLSHWLAIIDRQIPPDLTLFFAPDSTCKWGLVTISTDSAANKSNCTLTFYHTDPSPLWHDHYQHLDGIHGVSLAPDSTCKPATILPHQLFDKPFLSCATFFITPNQEDLSTCNEYDRRKLVHTPEGDHKVPLEASCSFLTNQPHSKHTSPSPQTLSQTTKPTLHHEVHLQHLPMVHLQLLPVKRFKEIHLHPLQHWMQPNALRYVLCAINKAKNGKGIFLDLPGQFVMAVEVYQVLVFLQVEECIGPLHGHIRQVIRERPLESIELEAVWYCLSNIAPKVYEFALSIQYERERQVWLLGPGIEDPELEDENTRIVEEETEASGEETVIEMDPNQDIEMISHDIDTASDGNGYTAEDEASDQEKEASNQEDEYKQLVTFIHLRRRSVPTPYSTRMYDIDTSDFASAQTKSLNTEQLGGKRASRIISNQICLSDKHLSSVEWWDTFREEWVGFLSPQKPQDVVERWLWRRSNRNLPNLSHVVFPALL
ncbi:hypothetical protein KCU84_g12, partial [Aureobasidium melanogenum]